MARKIIVDEEKLENAVKRCDEDQTNYFGQTYQQGVKDTLDWILGFLSDDDFQYGKDK